MSGRRLRPHLACRRGVPVVAAVTLAAVTALAVGCSSARPPAAPAGHSPSAAGATPAPAEREALADRYLAIALPANHRLDDEVDGFADHQRSDLAAAEAALRAEAATERGFDQELAAIAFPSGLAAMARALIQANQSRAALTGRQARSASLARLHSFAAGHRAADATVEFGVRLVRRALGLPPPSES